MTVAETMVKWGKFLVKKGINQLVSFSYNAKKYSPMELFFKFSVNYLSVLSHQIVMGNNSNFYREKIWLVSGSKFHCQTKISRFYLLSWCSLSDFKKKRLWVKVP